MSTITTKGGIRICDRDWDGGSPIARRGVLIGSLALALTAMGGRPVWGATKPTVSVHKSPT